MARKRYTPEQIIGMLREAEVRLSQGEKVGAISRSLGISEQSYYRWRREYGGLKVSQASRLKDLEKENQRLRKAVSDLTLDALILKEVVEGKYWALHGVGWPLIICRMCWVYPSGVPAGSLASTARPSASRPHLQQTRSR